MSKLRKVAIQDGDTLSDSPSADPAQYRRNGVVYGHVAHLTFVAGGGNLCPATIQHINVLSDTRVQNVRLNTEITFIFLHGIYSFHFCTFFISLHGGVSPHSQEKKFWWKYKIPLS